MPNPDGTPTDSERLATLENSVATLQTSINQILGIFAALSSEQGDLSTIINQSFACRCPDMGVSIQCVTHDFKVTYPNWKVSHPDMVT